MSLVLGIGMFEVMTSHDYHMLYMHMNRVHTCTTCITGIKQVDFLSGTWAFVKLSCMVPPHYSQFITKHCSFLLNVGVLYTIAEFKLMKDIVQYSTFSLFITRTW